MLIAANRLDAVNYNLAFEISSARLVINDATKEMLADAEHVLAAVSQISGRFHLGEVIPQLQVTATTTTNDTGPVRLRAELPIYSR